MSPSAGAKCMVYYQPDPQKEGQYHPAVVRACNNDGMYSVVYDTDGAKEFGIEPDRIRFPPKQIPRPPGRSPKGQIWDGETGKFVDLHKDDDAKDRDRTASPAHLPRTPHTPARPSVTGPGPLGARVAGRPKRERSRPDTFTPDDWREWVVEAILAHRTTADESTEYHVKWQGWDYKDNTWEPLAHVGQCSALDAYLAAQEPAPKRYPAPPPWHRSIPRGTADCGKSLTLSGQQHDQQ